MGGTDINTILDQILQASNMSLEDSKSSDIHNHRMKNALFSVLCEIKERTALSHAARFHQPQNRHACLSWWALGLAG